MNEIINYRLKNELKYKGTVVLKYEIDYPQIGLTQYFQGKEKFNTYNKNRALELEKYAQGELFEQAKKTFDFNVENGYPVMVYEVVEKYTVTYNFKSIVSLYSDQYTFTGGAHGNTIRTSQNWELRTGTQIPLQYFFYNNQYYVIDILKEINRQIEVQIKNNMGQYFDNYCQLVIENFNLNNYYILPNHIVIYYQQYDIAPYSSGIPTFKIKD